MKNDHLGAVEKDSSTGLSVRMLRAYDISSPSIAYPAAGTPECEAFLKKFHEETQALLDRFWPTRRVSIEEFKDRYPDGKDR